MPTDLDEMFTAMRTDADAVPLNPADAAREWGRQRSRRRAALAGVTAVVLVAAGVAVVTKPWDALLGRAHYELTGAGTFPRVGAEKIPIGAPRINQPGGQHIPGGPEVEIADGRAYAAWDDDGTTRVTAAALRYGQQLWSARFDGTFGDLLAVPGALLVEVGGQVQVLDPATGKLRWTASIGNHRSYLVAAGILMITEERVGATGYDLNTGEQRWSEAIGSDELREFRRMRTAADGTGMGAVDNLELFGRRGLPYYHDPRLVTKDGEGIVSVRDIRTGKVVRTVHDGQVTPRDGNDRMIFPYDGEVFEADGLDEDRPIWVTDVDGTAGSRLQYRVPAGRIFQDLTPCGTDLLCISDSPATRGDRPQLSAVRRSDHQELWRVDRPAGQVPQTRSGNRLLISSLIGAGYQAALYDLANGNQLLSPADQKARVGWAGPDRLVSIRNGEVALVSAADGSRRVLGSLPPGTDTSECSWTAARVVCPADSFLGIWDLTR